MSSCFNHLKKKNPTKREQKIDTAATASWLWCVYEQDEAFQLRLISRFPKPDVNKALAQNFWVFWSWVCRSGLSVFFFFFLERRDVNNRKHNEIMQHSPLPTRTHPEQQVLVATSALDLFRGFL